MDLNVRKIIELGKGAKCLSSASARYPHQISVKGVYSWLRIGIPEKHWQLVMDEASVTEAQIFAANRALENASEPYRKRCA